MPFLAESHAGQYLDAWASVTPDEDLACTLRLVAARERSHGEVFCRRIAELGFSLKPKRDPADGERLAKFADPRISDLEKIGPQRNGEDRDAFGDIKTKMAAGEYDPMTCNLLQWYIAEEGDSARRLREAYGCVRERANGRKAKANGSEAASADAQALMACMTQGFSRLESRSRKLAKPCAEVPVSRARHLSPPGTQDRLGATMPPSTAASTPRAHRRRTCEARPTGTARPRSLSDRDDQVVAAAVGQQTQAPPCAISAQPAPYT